MSKPTCRPNLNFETDLTMRKMSFIIFNTHNKSHEIDDFKYVGYIDVELKLSCCYFLINTTMIPKYYVIDCLILCS